MPVGATIGAVGSIAGAGIGAMGASSAAKTQANASNNAAQLQLGMYNTTRGDLAPYRGAGTAGLSAVYQLLGLSAPPTAGSGSTPGSALTMQPNGSYGMSTTLSDAQAQQLLNDRPDVLASWHQLNATADPNSPHSAAVGADNPLNYARYWYSNMGGNAQYQLPGSTAAAAGAGGSSLTGTGQTIGDFLAQTPGYQFQLQQGTQAVNNALAARGLGGLSGSLGKGLAKYVTGLADSTYQQQLGNYMDLAKLGENASVQTGTAGTTAAGNAGQAVTNAGTAAAGGQVGVANAISGGINGASNAYLTSKLLGSGMYGGNPAVASAGQGFLTDSAGDMSAFSGLY